MFDDYLPFGVAKISRNRPLVKVPSMLSYQTGKLTRKMLFRVLLARFGRLAHFLPDGFPLIILILLDGIEQALFLKAAC